MIVHLAADPLPYRLIDIVDVAPLHSPLPGRSGTAAHRRRIRRATAAVAAGALVAGTLAAVALANAPAAPMADPAPAAGEFRQAPGHAVPDSLETTGGAAIADPAEFHLAPGHSLPSTLTR